MTPEQFAEFTKRYIPEPNTGCWLWIGMYGTGGYGRFRMNGKTYAAHRVSYEHFIGPIPEGLTIDHVLARGCGNTSCVNPDHLEAVTSATNTMRGSSPTAKNARKLTCFAGHPFGGYNLRVTSDGVRVCRVCKRLRRRKSEHYGKGRPRGERHKNSKLNDATVRAIRERRASGDRIVDIARELGLHRDTIGRVIHGIRWKHVPLAATTETPTATGGER
jgi:hypothetical protein